MSLPSAPVLLALALVGGLAVILFVRAVVNTIALRRIGSAAPRDHDMERVASYLRGVTDHVALPARAWSDLDMDLVFQKLDHTVSWPGQHLLYARMRREVHNAATLQEFERGVGRLHADDALRDRVRGSLSPLDDRRASLLPSLFQGAPPALPAYAWIFPVLSSAGAGLLVAAFWWPALVVGIAGLVLLNAFLRAGMRERIDYVVPAVRMLPALLRASQALAAVDAPELAAQTRALRDALPRLQWLARAARWLSFDPTGGNEIAGYLYEYANLLFLVDVTSFSWSVGAIRAERAWIERAYVALGELDAMQSVASVRRGPVPWCRPELHGSARSLEFVDLAHPLLHAAVPNSLALSGRSVLLTGSNMSGKSTFIRTVGVNAVLAQSIQTVFAARWSGPHMVVRTSIGRADSLAEGTSYYRAEVDAVGSLLERRDAAPRLILIDELFRGTNSIERVAAARAVLERLDHAHDLVIVATHDAELIDLLPCYASWHFREEVRHGELTFDYLLRPGACSTRNALAVLALAGYPDEVVEDARRIADLIEQRLTRAGSASPA